MYISIDELSAGIHMESLEAVTRGDENKAEQAIKDAMSMVRSYLCVRYDIDTEFGRHGDDRDGMVVKLVRDIAIYYCYEGSSPVNMPETKTKAFDDSIAFLKSVQAEKAAMPGLQRIDAASGSNYVKYGGNTKRKNKWQ